MNIELLKEQNPSTVHKEEKSIEKKEKASLKSIDKQ